MTNRNNHIQIQIVFAAVGLLVPAHRIFQRLHRMSAFIDIVLLDKNLKFDLASTHGNEAIFDTFQLTRYQRKQVTRFGERVLPTNPMPVIIRFPVINFIAVGQQHRIANLISDQPGFILAHHIGTIEKVSDFSKTFGLALSTQHCAGLIKPFESRIVFRTYGRLYRQRETFRLRHLMNNQRLFCLHILITLQCLPVQHQTK